MAVNAKKKKPKFLRRPDARPDQILDAAEKVFGKYGYDAASLDRVARAAGITKGTIYLYFKNKKTVFIAMMKRRITSLLDGVREEVSNREIEDFDDYLDVILPNIRNFLTDPAYPSFFRLMVSESGRFPGIAQEFFESTILQVIRTGNAVYGDAARLKKVKALDGRIVFRCLIGMHLAFVFTQEILGGKDIDPLDWDEIYKTIETIFRNGIRRES